jgi:U3 small nucleolar ribonucleoprotein protein IMP4
MNILFLLKAFLLEEKKSKFFVIKKKLYLLMIQSLPIVFITTSRFPSSNLFKFIKEIKTVFPNSRLLNRGSYFLSKIVSICMYHQGTDLLMIHENRGKPVAFIVSHLPRGPSAFFGIENINFSLKIKKIRFFSDNPNLIIDNLESPLGKRLSGILCSLFFPSDLSSKRIVTFSGKENKILFRHHFFEKKCLKKKPISLHEIGPSMDLYPYKITLGNLSEKNAKSEWNLSIFIKKNKKKFLLNKQ